MKAQPLFGDGFCRGLIPLLTSLLVFGSLAGCTSQEEKAQQAIKEAVDKCRAANPDGPFVEIELREETDRVLPDGCEHEIEDFEMTSELSAKASTGPITWNVRIAKETGTWMLYAAEWPSLKRATGALEDDEPGEESMTYAETHFAKTQEEAPDNAWVKLRRLENLLDLRAETRDNRADDAYEIGEEAQKHFEETVAWAEEHEDVETLTEAQYLVADYVREYLEHVERVLSADGSLDERLEIAAEEAEEKGDDEEAEEYREEIEKNEKRREENEEVYGALEPKAEAYMCDILDDISVADVESTELQDNVAMVENAVNCSEVEPLADGDE